MFSADSMEAKALLTTPNGKGSYWILAQHIEKLGRKTIDNITVFSINVDQAQGSPTDPNYYIMIITFKDITAT